MLDKGVTRRSPGVHTSNDVDKTVVARRPPYLPHLFIICLCLPAFITYFNLLLRLYSTALLYNSASTVRMSPCICLLPISYLIA